MICEEKSGEWTPGLSEAERETLFAIGDDTLQWCVGNPKKAFSFKKYAITDKLKLNRATFVTLKTKKGTLRGCIGSLSPVAPLYRSVHDNAVNAALRDHRFPQVTARELPGLVVHISILSEIRPIASLEEFKIGEHGIILEKGRYSAVYLPEVAVEQGWTKEETLTFLSRKAGLSGDAWKKDTRFQVFSSVVLSKQAP
jgi:AmmeMemoRadiSam system protein A